MQLRLTTHFLPILVLVLAGLLFAFDPALAGDLSSGVGLGIRSGATGGSGPTRPASPTLLGGPSLAFIENRGQWDPNRCFVARQGGMAVTLERDAMALQFASNKQLRVVRLAFAGASPAVTVVGKRPLPGVYNFLVGDDATRWRSEVPAYSEVSYHEIWEGVEIRIHELEGRLKYDVVITPGVPLDRVAIRAEGFAGLEVEPDGSLAMQLGDGEVIRQPAPITWQETPSGAHVAVPCAYRVVAPDQYTFDSPERDPELSLVIDPGLEWSTFLGGLGDDSAWGVAQGNDGHVVVAGYTTALDFPTTPGVYDPTHSGSYDGFVSCFDPGRNGTAQLVWSTFLGGAGVERILALSLAGGSPDSVIVTGYTVSTDFPTTPGAFDQSANGSGDAFVCWLGGAGSSLQWSTFLGGSALDVGEALDVQPNGEVTVGGFTLSTAFPTTIGAYDTSHNGSRDVFVTRLIASGSALVYSTFLGGAGAEGYFDPSTRDVRFLGLAVEPDGETILAGRTESVDFPVTTGSYDTTYNGNSDAFLTRLNADGSALVWSTFLGGGSEDGALALTSGLGGAVAIASYTKGAMPTTPGAFDRSRGGPIDGHLTLLDADTGSNLLYGTYLGGSGYDAIFGVASDPILGDIIATGWGEAGFPVTPGAYDPTHNGSLDCFVLRLSPDGNGADDLVYSTFLGGFGDDYGNCVALDETQGNGFLSRAIVAGWTNSGGFPTTPGAYQTSTLEDGDAFVCRIGPLWPVDPTTAIASSSGQVGSPSVVRLVDVQPNPVRQLLSYGIETRGEARVEVGLYDVQGRLVARLRDERLAPGMHDFTWSPERALPRGAYVLRVEANGARDSRKVVLVP